MKTKQVMFEVPIYIYDALNWYCKKTKQTKRYILQQLLENFLTKKIQGFGEHMVKYD